MKIPNALQIKKWDNYTIKNTPISSYKLMEKAGRACVHKIINMFPENKFHIISNTGNNGGDGLVIFRELINHKKRARLTVINNLKKGTKDFKKNLKLVNKIKYKILTNEDQLQIHSDELIIDCIFGTGLKKPITGKIALIIEKINKSKCKVISIDMPSGLFCDDNRSNNGAIVKSNYTYTFEVPKISLLLPSYEKYSGQIHIIKIDLLKDYLKTIKLNYIYITNNNIPKIIKRTKFSHKGNFGHSLLVGGNKNMKGAIILAAMAAIKSGLGKLTVKLPKEYVKKLNFTLPEAIVNNKIDLQKLNHYHSIGIGPGLGLNKILELRQILKNRNNIPLVIDADAITIISKQKKILKLCSNTIFTPHIKEFKKLVGNYNSDEEKLNKQLLFSKTYNCILVLKGAHTTISTHDGQLYFNSTGNSGLAKAGSGDILTGLIASLLAQGYLMIEAAILGVYIHGYAADLCLKNETVESMRPLNIINNFSNVFNLIK